MDRDWVIRVLGPIDLLTTSGAQPIGSRHCRAVLWGDAPPKSADNSLQTYVSRLRQLVGSDALLHSDHAD